MRIPITINGREDPWRQERRYSLRGSPHVSDEYGYRRGRPGRELPGPSTRNRTNLAGDHDTLEAEESNRFVDDGKEAVRENRVPIQKQDAARTEEPHEDWKERYIRLRADFDNYKRHAEAQRQELAGIGKEAILEDVFPLVEHMERAIRAARDANDQTGILEGLEMVYNELLRILEKHGVERIDTIGRPFDPEIHDAVSVVPHPDPAYTEDTVVEEVRAGFVKDGKLLRPASVVVAQ